MHPRRSDIEEALTDLRTRVPGGKIVDPWGGEPARSTPEQQRLREEWLDTLAAALDEALKAQAFEPIAIPDARSPPGWELILAHALKRLGGPVASFPDFSESRQEEEGTFITLGTDYNELVVYQGPLELHGHVQLSGTVIVLGDLIVHGALYDGAPSDSGLIVIGNERSRATYINSHHLVVGDLETDLLVTPVHSNGSWDVGGEVRARLRLEHYEADAAGDTLRRWLDPVPPEELRQTGYDLSIQVGSGRSKVRASPLEG